MACALQNPVPKYVPGDNLMGLLEEKLPPDVMASLPEFELYEYPQLIDSSNIRPDNWKQIASDIASRYEQFDGFVVLHGTDTMAYSCSMISFMLQNLQKPVIFTGSQIPLCEARTDGLENLVGALTMAADDRIKEVCLYFNGRLLRGNRSRKLNAYLFDAFDSPNYPWLGRADIHVELNESLLWQPKGKEKFQLECDSDTHVGILQLFPGINAQWMVSALSQPMDAFILRTYGTGNGPDADHALLGRGHPCRTMKASCGNQRGKKNFSWNAIQTPMLEFCSCSRVLMPSGWCQP